MENQFLGPVPFAWLLGESPWVKTGSSVNGQALKKNSRLDNAPNGCLKSNSEANLIKL